MPIRRIASFLPSATELIYELGVQDMLFGVTHECLYPADAASKPRVISAVFDPQHMSSREIDEKTRSLMEGGHDIFRLDEDVLCAARPDLIVSQNTCQVCAAHTGQVDAALKALPQKPRVHSMDPHSMEEILDGIVEFAEMVGVPERGRRLRASLEDRIRTVTGRLTGSTPRVLALEWLDPFFTAGHWVPEMIRAAGGQNLVSGTGEHSRIMSFDEIAAADPDIILLMPCGFDTRRTASDYRSVLQDRKDWQGLRAVEDGQVYALDANSYFSKPGIRTVTGIEILAGILHPRASADIPVPAGSSERV